MHAHDEQTTANITEKRGEHFASIEGRILGVEKQLEVLSEQTIANNMTIRSFVGGRSAQGGTKVEECEVFVFTLGAGAPLA